MTEDEARELGTSQARSEFSEGATVPVRNPGAMMPDEPSAVVSAFVKAYADEWYWLLRQP